MEYPIFSYEEKNKLQYKLWIIFQNVCVETADSANSFTQENTSCVQFTKNQIPDFKACLLSNKKEDANIELMDIDSWSEEEMEQITAMSAEIREKYQSTTKISQLPVFFQIPLYRLLMKPPETDEKCVGCPIQSVCDINRNSVLPKKKTDFSEQNCQLYQWRISMSSVLQFDILIKKPVARLSTSEILTLVAIAFLQEQEFSFK